MITLRKSLLLLTAIACGIGNTAPVHSAQLVFQSGFEPGSTVTLQAGDALRAVDITGTDTSVAAPNNWTTDLEGHPKIGGFGIWYGSPNASSADSWANIVDDPTTSGSNRVLHYKAINGVEPHSSGTWFKSRIQTNMYNNPDLKEFYYTFRMYLHPDLEKLKTGTEPVTWLTLAEIWNNPSFLDRPNDYGLRISVELNKASGTNQNLFFLVRAQDHNAAPGASPQYTTIWEVSDPGYSVPTGVWLNCEIRCKEGNGSTGKFYFSVAPAGGNARVICDRTDFTHHTQHPTSGPLAVFNGFEGLNALKMYCSAGTLSRVRDLGGYLQIYWDDFKFYDGLPASTPPAPNGLIATKQGYNQVNLSWTDNAGNETGFHIERKRGTGGTYAQIGTAGVNAISYSDMTAGAGTTYYYRVRAYNGNGNSLFSSEANATTDEITSGRQAHWKLDASSGTTVTDSSGNSNTGTASGGPTWVAGKIANGLNLDGADDIVNAGSGTSLDNLSALTVSAWIKADTMGEGGKGRIVVKGTGPTPTAGWSLLVGTGNQLEFAVNYTTTNLWRISNPNVIGTAAWRHVMVTWNGSPTATNAKFYVCLLYTSPSPRD